jgi:hypothetical protein
MQKWEYKTVVRSRGWEAQRRGEDYHRPSDWGHLFEDKKELSASVTLETKLDELGKQGWELVAVVPNSSVLGAGEGFQTVDEGLQTRDYAGFTNAERWVFKRPLE